MDPLELLPAEIVLRILEFAPIADLANLTRLNKSWHEFIDGTHQDAIYSSPSKTSTPSGSKDLSFLADSTSFVKYFDGITSFKELCKRQTLLQRNWNSKHPVSRESVYQVGNDPVWRFRADFERRFFISTSEHGGLSVTAMNTGALLWHLPRADVKPFAHLEYQDGIAVWDSKMANDLEIWKTDIDFLPLGVFKRIAVLPHSCNIRGFQLSYNTLCVISSEQQAFVYDMKHKRPQLVVQMKIDENVVGHLDQNEDTMMISMGLHGYHFHDKASGTLLGSLQPTSCKKFYHAHHPQIARNSIVTTGNSLSSLPSVEVYPPKQPNKHRFLRLDILNGLLPLNGDHVLRTDHILTSLQDDEWGAALFSGLMMVGYSRAGRILICTDWKSSLKDPESFAQHSYIIECESDGDGTNLGGWLSVRDNRLMFEIRKAGVDSLIYVIALEDDGSIRTVEEHPSRPSYAFDTRSATPMESAVSFMALFDDCIMATYTTLGWSRRDRPPDPQHLPHRSIFPVKMIRVLTLAPEMGSRTGELNGPNEGSSDDTHAAILELMDMLSEDEESESDEAT